MRFYFAAPLFLLLILPAFLTGCAVNPVTGKTELSLVSESRELAMGLAEFNSLRQSEGGDYILDQALSDYVNEVGQKIAAVSDRELPYEFKIVNNSTPQALALPGGKISLFRGLLAELHSEAELAAVLGHEITHAAAKHAVRAITRERLIQGALLALAIGTDGKKYAPLLRTGAGLGAGLLNLKYDRDKEREADYYGMLYMSRAGYDPKGAVELQQTFLQLFKEQRSDWLAGLFATHPPSSERVENNKQTLINLQSGGETGEKRFQKLTAHLKRSKPAYAALDRGRAALAKGDLAKASAEARKAISIEPAEAHFHALLGDVQIQKHRLAKAKSHFDKAISLNEDFYYYYLKRGLINQDQQNAARARHDLEKSAQLLPTAYAYNALGNFALDDGDTDKAKEYFSAASADKGPAGKEAYSSLIELDLENDPGKYLQVSSRVVGNSLVCKIVNPTPKGVTDIALQINVTFRKGKGKRFSTMVPVNGVVSPGGIGRVTFDLGYTSQSAIKNVSTYLFSARVVN